MVFPEVELSAIGRKQTPVRFGGGERLLNTMAWRFKVSKFKNATPKFPKKEELIQEVPVGNPSYSCGNHIKASCVYMVFNVDTTNGGSLGYLPLNAQGRIGSDLCYIHAHGEFVSDYDFSPFDDYMLASGAYDNTIKVWLLPEEFVRGSVTDPVLSLPTQNHRIENVLWHPTAEGVLSVSTDKSIKIFDVAAGKENYANNVHGDQVQSISWKSTGSVIASTCKDKHLRLLDLRGNAVVQETEGHQNVKDTRVLWLGETEYIFSTGFNRNQQREYKLWDIRAFQSPLVTSDAQGNGTLMCFYDEDTKMVFLAGKSDSSIKFLELTEKSPYLTEGMTDHTEQIKGAALVPKRAMELMSGEVDRLLLLARQSIISVPFIVPRKSYRDFHDDLYPETACGEPALTAEQWFSGEDNVVAKVKPTPNKPLVKHERRGLLLGNGTKYSYSNQEEIAVSKVEVTVKPSVTAPKPAVQQKNPAVTPGAQDSKRVTSPSSTNIPTSKVNLNGLLETQQPPAEPAENPAKIIKAFKGVHQSKLRYVIGKTLHPSTHITNIKNLCKTIPGESDFFVANNHRCAVPLEGAGGIIAILELTQPGRLGNTIEEMPTIQNGSKVADFVWDPFDDFRLVVACDNARINVWKIPPEGLPVGPSQDKPEFYLRGHSEKVYFVRYHPLVKDILMSSSYDMTVRMWNLSTKSEVMQLRGQEDQVFCIGWSPCSKLCATVCKDGLIRVYEPRKSPDPIRQGKGPDGSRGARVLWVLDGHYLLVSGFEKTSNQQLIMYNAETLQVLNTVEVERNPSILIPHYDEDTSVIYLHARGERTVDNYEVCDESPYLFPNTSINLTSLHQGLVFVPRNKLDVAAVEVARAWRLTNNTVEPVSFTVPRVRTEYFQDDLFPDTRVTWEPALTADQWLAGQNTKPRTISLRPVGMKLLSEAPLEEPKPKKYESYNPSVYKSDEQKKDELMTAIVGKLELSSEPLPQDLAEGVEEDEWED
ncbi:coronin-7-like isoform X2 [Pomacea canaliculata]|uniref:coronin-7-like isoform X2 n=1 Tax=Pomacea canaliculata TaxID=400727 RepID=UPI000D737A5F|nr:coronin-7-like isoform X2 [Pomacea canaliculata]